VLPFTPEETVMHHAHSEEQQKQKENHHEYDPEDQKRWWLLPRTGRRVHILIHQSASIPAPAPNALSRNTMQIPGAHPPWDISSIRVLAFLVPGRPHRKNRSPRIGPVLGCCNHSTLCIPDHTANLAAAHFFRQILESSLARSTQIVPV
jgi:hypothetical protein